MGGLSAQQSQKWSFYLISKNQIVILMLVMTLMGRMKTVPRMKVLRLQMQTTFTRMLRSWRSASLRPKHLA